MKRLTMLMALMAAIILAKADIIESFDKEHADGYNYWLYSPDTFRPDTDSVAEAKPLVIFLHGQSLTGTDMDRVLRYGPIDAIRRGRNIDAYVLAPQNPGGRWNPDKVFHIVDTLIDRYPIDTTRIYVLGMSLGGFGTINTAAAYPHRIAAAMALCGGGNNPDYGSLGQVPLWILHGTADRAVSIKDSEKVVAGLKGAGASDRVIYTPLSKQNHSILARAFYMPQTYDWLFQHSLADSTRTLNTDYAIGVGDLKTAYAGISSVGKSTVPIVRHHTTTTAAKATKGTSKGSTSKGSSSKSSADGASYYTVKKGDTLSGIAKKQHTTVKKLCSLNGITAKTTLKIGRRLRVR